MKSKIINVNFILVICICIMSYVVLYRQKGSRVVLDYFQNKPKPLSYNRCAWMPHKLTGKLKLPVLGKDYIPTLDELENLIQTSPLGCEPRRNVAIIVPYRNREIQLRIFLQHIHPILQRQKLQYTIFIIEQFGDERFNRAKLLNVGFQEARKVGKFDCFILHDVDILMENDKCFLCLETHTLHFATKLNKFDYKKREYSIPVCYKNKEMNLTIPYYGGVLRVAEEDMLKANGFSNEYWSLGLGDDDFYFRLQWKDVHLEATDKNDVCRHSTLNHSQHEPLSTDSTQVKFLLKHSISRIEFDGLNNLKYEVKHRNVGRLYTNITVDLGRPLPIFLNNRFNNLDKTIICDGIKVLLSQKF